MKLFKQHVSNKRDANEYSVLSLSSKTRNVPNIQNSEQSERRRYNHHCSFSIMSQNTITNTRETGDWVSFFAFNPESIFLVFMIVNKCFFKYSSILNQLKNPIIPIRILYVIIESI